MGSEKEPEPGPQGTRGVVLRVLGVVPRILGVIPRVLGVWSPGY